ncbi:MAG TPA: indolepyruvate ferredoxin oxidoreductase subunit alpha [Candidatus Pullichristensenella excrementigallinarum]|uniref:Indolepyruvate oxidoreductase subunit IorA n=1 Tax=Candidatus Pullichristensenella excrementigallinarum TaxID=2840907 RepID=A0A9D1IAE8_9FIRM|nr:indolepyruvate ferredoxin oxidoreductase subunit alpha [Candidatus Pullichristensenella excrementigallinarum]
MKTLMLGNAAVARGLYEAGCRFVSSYPGTPSTEITEQAAGYDEIYCEWAPNEKVALESALGAAIAGARSFCAMKHVGLNVAADPLFTSAYTGVNAALVVAVADDPGMHSSQNEQDSRHYAMAAKLPMLEPSDSEECRDFAVLANELSERFDTPVLLRTATRVAHSQSLLETHERRDVPLKPYEKNPAKYVMSPGNAIPRHADVEKRLAELAAYSETAEINRAELRSREIGFVASGVCYQYVREAFPEASVFKIGMSYPLPIQAIARFAAQVDKLIVVEELDPVFETALRAAGIRVSGGKNLFGLLGELSQSKILQAMGASAPAGKVFGEALPQRPPVMCAGCPHRGLFAVLSRMKLTVLGDIGCYTLGAAKPLAALDTTVCMGASISALHGFTTVRPEEAGKTVAVIGDSTFMHSGITGVVNVAYNKGISTILVLDNAITGMTGHQQNPTTGLTLKNQPTPPIRIEKVLEGIGIRRVRVVDPNDMAALEQALREELAVAEPSVIISRRPCALLKYVKHKPALIVDSARCRGCKQCMRLGCPAIRFEDHKAIIDSTQCVGCGLCAQTCGFGAIGEGKA